MHNYQILYSEEDQGYIATVLNNSKYEFITGFGTSPAKALDELQFVLGVLEEED